MTSRMPAGKRRPGSSARRPRREPGNLVRIVARNLRRKLGDDAASPAYIFNERGVGYRMAEPGGG